MKKIPTVQAVMTPFPYSIDASASLREAQHMMRSHEVRHLPVVADQELAGVITDRDLKRALDPSIGLPPKNELFVNDVMVRDPYVVETTERLDNVLEEMGEELIGCVLVVREGKLVGIFTTTDACLEFASHLRAGWPEGGSDAA
jgi:CBS domain-containing protein